MDIQIIHPSTLEDFQDALLRHGVDSTQWKNVSAATLFKEVQSGESVLEARNGKLFRKIYVVSVHCFYTNHQGERFFLEEEKQILTLEEGKQVTRVRLIERTMPDGSIAMMPYDFVSETIQPGENPQSAAKRGLHEELDMKVDDVARLHIERFPERDEDKNKESSPTRGYPGILTNYIVYHFKTDLPLDLVKDHYVENDDDILTYFHWVKA